LRGRIIHCGNAAARILASGGDFLKVPQEVAAEAALLVADLKARGLA